MPIRPAPWSYPPPAGAPHPDDLGSDRRRARSRRLEDREDRQGAARPAALPSSAEIASSPRQQQLAGVEASEHFRSGIKERPRWVNTTFPSAQTSPRRSCLTMSEAASKPPSSSSPGRAPAPLSWHWSRPWRQPAGRSVPLAPRRAMGRTACPRPGRLRRGRRPSQLGRTAPVKALLRPPRQGGREA